MSDQIFNWHIANHKEGKCYSGCPWCHISELEAQKTRSQEHYIKLLREKDAELAKLKGKLKRAIKYGTDNAWWQEVKALLQERAMSCEKCGCQPAFMKVPHADTCECNRCRRVSELEQQLADCTEEWSKHCGELTHERNVLQRICAERAAELAELRERNTEYQRLYNEMAGAYSKQKKQLAELKRECQQINTRLNSATRALLQGEGDES